ncbi:MAG TPA: LysM domain-containing protein [Chromatiaceae bacterium]|nr:LysM domain-containing protein [Chromatiaceae bacterium]
MNKMSRFLLAMFMATALAGASWAAEQLLKPGHPTHYVVKKGDTLWDIAGMFLHDPWRWPEIWQANPQIRNPHLIYPGDELNLVYVDGKPQLTLNRGPLKLSPRIRSAPIEQAIPTIPIDHIAPYLTRPYVLDRKEMQRMPYVVAFADEHIAAGAGQRLYVRRILERDQKQFDIVRPGEAYLDADTGEVLGYEALYTGSGRLLNPGDPATVAVHRTQREILEGDRLLPFTQNNAVTDFHPRAPDQEINGAIIDVLDRVYEIGQYDVVVLDKGLADGVEPGVVLQVNNRGETVADRTARRQRNLVPIVAEYTMDQELVHEVEPEGWQRPSPWEKVKLPDEEAGLLMVFRSFERVSFGLIM